MFWNFMNLLFIWESLEIEKYTKLFLNFSSKHYTHTHTHSSMLYKTCCELIVLIEGPYVIISYSGKHY